MFASARSGMLTPVELDQEAEMQRSRMMIHTAPGSIAGRLERTRRHADDREALIVLRPLR